MSAGRGAYGLELRGVALPSESLVLTDQRSRQGRLSWIPELDLVPASGDGIAVTTGAQQTMPNATR
jgi:hypothetical protein